SSEILDEKLLLRVSAAKDASEALLLIADERQKSGGVVDVADCRMIISSALDCGNADLALSVFSAMRSSFDGGLVESASPSQRWKWSRPDVDTYTLMIIGLASLLRVSDALRLIDFVCRVGVSPGEEVPFGKVVRCPCCMVAVAVAQPHFFFGGLDLVSCSKCRYQYELISGKIVSIESEEISMDVPAWKRGLQFLQMMKQKVPVAVHSIVVETPSGMARTHRFATETVDLPAREGERVTVSVAAPLSVDRKFGPLKLSSRSPNFYPGEPMCLMNHKDGRESRLLRAPSKDAVKSILSPHFLFPIIAIFGTGDAASGIIDPSLPRLIAIAAVSSAAVGVTFNSLILPQLNKLPLKSVDVTSIKQQLLSQYDVLQSRMKELKKATENEVWMLARMCRLQNQIYAVGEPAYRTRRSRVKRARFGLEGSLKNRIELMDSYARICWMIEIEVELESDAVAAEAATSTENTAQQIEQMMEIEKLEEATEANDEAERLLSSSSV
ncbi:hypothetical protein M569_00680, partial [Genlisea aurea]